MDTILRLTIDNYTLPAIASGSKYIYGTINDVASFINLLKSSNQCEGLCSAFERYQNGEIKVQYNVAYSMEQLAKTCKILGQKSSYKNNFSYTFLNAWGFDYEFISDVFYYDRILIKDGKNLIVAIKPRFINLKIRDEQFGDRFIDHTWGYPCIYIYDEPEMAAQIYLVEKEFKIINKDDRQAAEEYFNSEEFDLTQVFAEVVADG